jgi:chorismate mutase
MSNQLENWRQAIDALDEQLLMILAERLQIVEAIGQFKKEQGLAPLDETRWQKVLQSKMARAHELDLSPEFVRALYELIHEHSLKIESTP